MSSRKSKWIILTATLACIGCCAIPVSLIVAGASSLGMLATLAHKQNLEALICLAPLVLIAGYFIYKRHKANPPCCSAPTSECTSKQCSNS